VVERSLEEQLRDVGIHLDTGAPPDVAAGVVRRLRSAPAPLKLRARRRLVAVVSAVVAAVLTAGLLSVPAVRAAVVDLFSLPGVVFDRDRPQPPKPTATAIGPLGTAYQLTRPVTLDAARRELPGRVLTPPDLGAPDEVYVTGDGDRKAVHLLWHARPDLPALPGSTAGLYLSVFGQEVNAMLQKMIRAVPVEEVKVGDRLAVWIGAEHGTVLFGADGMPDYATERLAGPTLLVDRGGYTVRVESRLAKADAIRLAESLR